MTEILAHLLGDYVLQSDWMARGIMRNLEANEKRAWTADATGKFSGTKA